MHGREATEASGARRRGRLRLGGTVLLACGLGLLGLWWAVSGGGPSGTVRGRAITSAAFFLSAGAALRLIRGGPVGRRSWLLVGLVAAGPAALGATGIVLTLQGGARGGDFPLALLYLTGPAAFAAAGWALAGRARMRRSRPGRNAGQRTI